jgi:O-antigen/teichoic acid export membrane protein/peptidoglycan/xylan/chitin deacetylase (PgdA/CDA1 family)
MKNRFRATLVKLASQRSMNFAFVDQVLVSGSNFVAGILLARAFGIFEFGRFALAWMFVEFIGSLQFAAIIQPMLNIGPKQTETDSDRYYDAVIAQQAAACMVFGVVAWLSATVAGWLLSDPEFSRLALPLCAAIMGYQLQCFFRRYFFARDRPLAGLVNDALRFAVQIAATVALAFVWPGSTAGAGLWIVAAACAVSALQGVLCFGRPKWNRAVFVDVSVRHWAFSKWLLPSALMYWMTTQGFALMSGFVLGAAATGSLRAAISIVGVVNILLLALDNFAPVQAARAVHVGGPFKLRRNIARLALLTGTLVMTMVALININPGYLVHLLYGERFASIEQLVRWLCAPASVFAISTVLVIWAGALERTRTIFISYAAATVFTAIAAYPLTRYGGLAGVVAGSFLVETIRAAVLLVAFVRWSKAIMSEEVQCAVHARRATRARGGIPWQMKQDLYRSGLWFLAASGLPRLMARHSAGQGAILSFHRVYLPGPHEFGSQPQSIAPENFRRLVRTLQERGYDFLTMSALADRLRTGELARRKFVCLSFDDGFVDTYGEAYAICREFGVPMTVYLVSGFMRRDFPMWSFGLEKALAANDVLEFTWEGKEVRLDVRTMGQKRQAFLTVAPLFVRAQPQGVQRLCAELGARYGIDFMALSDQNALTPAMVREMHASGLVEFGVHSVHHAYLSQLDNSGAHREIMQSKRDCEALVGAEVRHFAYPYGDERSFGSREIKFCRELGFQTAVTTESNTIFASDRDRLLALPRLTYSGTFQDTPLLDLLLSGALPRLRRGLRAWPMSVPVTNSPPTPLSVAASGGPEKLLG